ncbi:MAG: N-acetylmuramoyl-L-alanine amidase family protein [Alistipes ihumii]
MFLAASVTSNAQNRKIGINTVVIDAGHGGPDAGAVGRLYKEKDINLDVALRFGRMISEHYPDVQVIYTRKTDVLIPLAERGDIANRAKADLFISIHINSNKSSSPSGVSVYVMGVDKASKNMDVAMKENDVITYEEDYSTRYQGYKPGSTESLIMFSLMQYAYQTQSCLLADMVQKQFVGNTQMQDWRPPSGLSGAVARRDAEHPVRVRFISNPTEEKFIGSKKGRETYARSLFNAFSQYKVRSEGRGTPDCS